MGGAEGHQGVHALVPAEPGDVVAGDQAAHAVADDVDALVAGLGDELLDLLGELGRRGSDVGGQRGVVHRRDPAEPAPAQAQAQQGEDRAVVDHAVHQQDRRPGGLDVGDDQTALHRGQVLDAVAVLAVRAVARDEPPGVERDVGGEPGRLDGRAHEPRGGRQGPCGATDDVVGGTRSPGDLGGGARDRPREQGDLGLARRRRRRRGPLQCGCRGAETSDALRHGLADGSRFEAHIRGQEVTIWTCRARAGPRECSPPAARQARRGASLRP